jgi:putative DNA primase/helicase
MTAEIKPPDARLAGKVTVLKLAPQPKDARAPAFTDEALALRFADTHVNHLRYVAVWGRWLSFDGARWQFDETLAAFDNARKICREVAAECNTKKTAAALAAAKTVAAVVNLARADRRLAATVDQWDTDPWLLNTPGGVVDLRNGQSRLHRPDDYMTKITGISPDASCPIPTWLQFLDRITARNSDLIAYLKRITGYALTGHNREHALFFLYGTGANGKSTFINVLICCAGGYHRTAPIETFTDSQNDRHPTDLAGLRGARLVTAVETEEGRRWAESRIKTLTGGDRIAARFMRQDFFEFIPQFKLLIAGNHKPGLRSVDEAIRRRLHLIPFAVTIPAAERDLNLLDKLTGELPGIFAWVIEGCLEWQRHGLQPPEAVTTATETYLSQEDSFAGWLDDRCLCEPDAWENATALFKSWKVWAEDAGERVGTQKGFSGRLGDRGFAPKRSKSGRGFLGIRLISGVQADG